MESARHRAGIIAAPSHSASRYGDHPGQGYILDFRRERDIESVSGNTVRLDFALLSKLFNYARSDWGWEACKILRNWWPSRNRLKTRIDAWEMVW